MAKYNPRVPVIAALGLRPRREASDGAASGVAVSCVRHPTLEALLVCERCRAELCALCLAASPVAGCCPNCGHAGRLLPLQVSAPVEVVTSVKGPRVGAALLDVVVLLAVWTLLAALTHNIHTQRSGSGVRYNVSLEGQPFLVFQAIVLFYFAIPEKLWGASVGKAAFGLRVIGNNGALTWRAALLRNLLRGRRPYRTTASTACRNPSSSNGFWRKPATPMPPNRDSASETG